MPGRQAAKGGGGSVVTVESAPCEVFVGEGVCWATAVAAAGASAEPVPPSEGTAKTESKAVSAAGKNVSAARTAIGGGDGGRYTSAESSRRSREVVNPHACPCAQKSRISRKSEEAEGSPSETALSVRGTSPPMPTVGVGQERLRSPQARMRKTPPSSTGVSLLDPPRSCRGRLG